MIAGRFLEPLYYRLNVLRIHIPPLRDRLDDLAILVERLYAQLTSSMLPSEVPTIQMNSIRNLLNYHWPGNVRELKNVLERALMRAQGNRIVFRSRMDETAPADAAPCLTDVYGDTLRAARKKITKLMCEEALRRTGGNKAQAAKSLGVTRGALYRIVRQFGIEL